jgi:hypothetical protein
VKSAGLRNIKVFSAVFDHRRKDRNCDVPNRIFKDLSRNYKRQVLFGFDCANVRP